MDQIIGADPGVNSGVWMVKNTPWMMFLDGCGRRNTWLVTICSTTAEGVSPSVPNSPVVLQKSVRGNLSLGSHGEGTLEVN